MRINKVSKSNSFDLYSTTMQNFLHKQAGFVAALKRLGLGGEAAEVVGKVLPDAARLTEYTGFLSSLDKPTEEIGKRLRDINVLQKELNAITDPALKAAKQADIEIQSLAVLPKIRAAAEAAVPSIKAEITSTMSPEVAQIFFGGKLDDIIMGSLLADRTGGTISRYRFNVPGYQNMVSEFATGAADIPLLSSSKHMDAFIALDKASVAHPEIFKYPARDVDELIELASDPAAMLGRARAAEGAAETLRRVTPEAIEAADSSIASIVAKADSIPDPTDMNKLDDIQAGLGALDELKNADELRTIERLIETAASEGRPAEKAALLEKYLEAQTAITRKAEAYMEAAKRLPEPEAVVVRETAERVIREGAENGNSLHERLTALGVKAAALVTLKNFVTTAAMIAAGAAGATFLYRAFSSPSGSGTGASIRPVTQSDPEIRRSVQSAVQSKNDKKVEAVLANLPPPGQGTAKNPGITQKELDYIARHYGKTRGYVLPREYNGLKYVFIDKNLGDTEVFQRLSLVLDSVDSRQGQKLLKSKYKVQAFSDNQRDLNNITDLVIKNKLYNQERLKRERMGRRLRNRPRLENKKVRKYSEETRSSDRLQKLAYLKDISLNSTNNHSNNDTNLLKEADDVSKSYVKDAVKGLNNEDKTLREYFTGLGRLYDAESEKRNPDYEELYELHNETGRDLILSAHPKAIRVSEGLGNGGLVENGLEQKEKLEDVALSAPTGNFKSRYAKLKNLLIKSSKT